MTLQDIGHVAVMFCGLGFIGLGYAVDSDSRRFGHFRRFGMTPPAYWALGFWSFFALAVNTPTHPWLTTLDGFIAVVTTLHHLRDRFKARRRRRTTKEPTA